MIDPLAARKREVPTDFDAIARRYDLLVGMNPGYRKHLRWSAQRLLAAPQSRLLDLCCGTGLSTEALRTTYPRALIDALDGSAGMLGVARSKDSLAGVRFVLGDAMEPGAAGLAPGYDGILMAYGIRNMPDRDLALDRLRDQLVPGGRLAIHEYSVADSKVAEWVWRLVSSTVIVPSGRLAYGLGPVPEQTLFSYLRESVLAFDGVTAFEARLRRAGFINVRTEAMDGWQRGVVHTFLAERPT